MEQTIKVICKFRYKCRYYRICSHAKPHTKLKVCDIPCSFFKYGKSVGDVNTPKNSVCVPVFKRKKNKKKKQRSKNDGKKR